ncbi:MAG: molybdopterin-guanine dinucleotide biosynthesis protein B [Anaerolineae bacterium]|nr:molybdopterin-guanine dinucleotide biosynthesis protein B [Anaerolineae bacterium]
MSGSKSSEMHIPVVAFVGRSNSGKTTIVERLLPVLKARGYRVAVVKHTLRNDIESDLPGKDTRRFWDAGAAHTTLATADRIVHTRRYEDVPSLEMALRGVCDVDLILLEGYKEGLHPKIEVVRAARDPHLLHDLAGRVACVTDVAGLPWDGPCFGFDDIPALADFIVARFVERREGRG